MGMFYDWIELVKKYSYFQKKELQAILISIVVIAFAISFNKWGVGKEVDVPYGLLNLVLAIIVVGISFFFRQYFQKSVGMMVSLNAEYHMWSIGLLLSVLLVFVTNGHVWFLIPGGIFIHFMTGNRLGWVRYGLNYWAMGVVSLLGPIANLLLAIVFKLLFEVFHFEILKVGFVLNLIWAVWSMVPIPPGDGSRVLFGSRLVYMWSLAMICSVAGILYFSKLNIFLTILISMVVAFVWWIIYYMVWERFNWRGPY